MFFVVRVKWDKISFYDKKFLVRILIERELVKQFQEVMFFEEMLLFIHGISVSEHDAVLQAWREKIRHDIVRPTTVIQTWNDDLITFDGNRESPKVANIKARDFQAFLRVMPHSEYPSGSSCICSAYQEFTDAFTTKYYKGNLTNLRWGPDGVDLGCNEFSTFDEVNAAFYGCKHGGFGILNMKVLAEECGESRLWGGMHFGDSVPAGQQLCSGLGSLGVEYASEIRNGSKFESSHIKGMERPICNTHSTQTPGPTPKFYTKNVAEEFLTYSAASSKQHVSQKLGRGILASILMTFFF